MSPTTKKGGQKKYREGRNVSKEEGGQGKPDKEISKENQRTPSKKHTDHPQTNKIN